ncbi:MAG TPA: cysteine dioxygenase family protein [Rhodanobacteraceae bacterium]|nr:cysteine dioxygenase family protein [Rhodanobacteraceae bacterium]
MPAIDFPGRSKLIDALDSAVTQADTAQVTRALRDALCRMIRASDVELPACVFECCADHYARRELYRSDEHGYCVVAMTWSPGQGTPIHDHSGMWCVEGVWRGELEVVQYELLEHDERRYHFRPAGAIQAGPGSAGSLIPPHEYHTIRNPSDDVVTVSLHVYQDRMTCCSVFEPLGGDWYARGERELPQDSTVAAHV